SFTVVATGSGPLSFQWSRGSTPLANGTTSTGSTVGGAQSATLTLSNVSAADAGNYSVLVTNTAGSATSNTATLTVNGPVVTPPAITTQPASQSVSTTGSVTFTVAASGTTP